MPQVQQLNKDELQIRAQFEEMRVDEGHNIKTLIFDIGGVITHTDFDKLYTNFALRVGVSPEFVIQYHEDYLADMLLGKVTFTEFLEDMIKAGAKSDLDIKAIWIEEGISSRNTDHINQELLGVIKKLREKYTVETLTNLTESRLLLDEKIDLYSNFDYAILSCVEHLKKPDPAFYKLALARTGVKPEEAIFIDDKESCVIAAEDIGMKGIVYTNNEELMKELSKFGIIIK